MPLKVTMVNADPLGEEINVMFKVRRLELFFGFCLLDFLEGGFLFWWGEGRPIARFPFPAGWFYFYQQTSGVLIYFFFFLLMLFLMCMT